MGKKIEIVRICIFLGSKITADGDCSHEIKRRLHLRRKDMTNLDNVLKSRDITLPTKVCLVKAMVFLNVQMWESDSHSVMSIDGWALKNWCFWTVVLEKTLESPLDCKEIKPVNPKGNQPWIFIGRTEAEAEAPILWPPDGIFKSLLSWKRPWCWERLKAGGERDDRGWDDWMASLSQWTWVWADSGRQWRTGKPGVLQSMGSQRFRHDWATEQRQQIHQREFAGHL